MCQALGVAEVGKIPRIAQQVDLPVGQRIFPVQIRRNARARRLQFRLEITTGTVKLTLPPGVSQAEGLAFVAAKADWIAPRRARILDQRIALIPGASIPVEGHWQPLTFGSAPILQADQVVVRALSPAADLAQLLKTHARIQLTALVHTKAAQIGKPVTRLTFRDTKSRWGSCSARGAIALNWRIVCAEPLVQDYLVAHEVAHLAEPHHQPPFWRLCAQLMAQPQGLAAARAKLRAVGPQILALPLHTS